MKHSRFTHIPVALAVLLVLTGIGFGQHGPQREIGANVEQRLVLGGQNQKVLVIYAQASDYQILPADLAALNAKMDLERNNVSPWFKETTYNKLAVDMIPQRKTGGEWYTLPSSLLEYVRPTDAQSIQARNAASATSVDPTPATSVTAKTVATTDSNFGERDVGNYRYAVSTFHNGRESKLTKVPNPITVAAGDAVTVTINGADVVGARYLIYRTLAGKADVDSNYFRIGQKDVDGPTVIFSDNGIKMDQEGDLSNLVTDAMREVRAHVPDYGIFNGVLVVIFAPEIRGQAERTAVFTLDEKEKKDINISAAFVSSCHGFERYTHEMGHWLGLPDLYDPDHGRIATWDTMDCACDGQFQTWSKDYRLGLLNPENVRELRRPPAGGPDFDQDFIIHPTEVENTFRDRLTALKIKVSETIHYYIEGRRQIAGKISDQQTPKENILITKTIDAWSIGILPRRNVEWLKALHAGDPAFSPDPGVQITFTSLNKSGDDESYKVNVKLKAGPQAQPDLRITPWSPPAWESADIWVDSAREGGGFQDPATATPLPGGGENAWLNQENRVWAKITNMGDAPANNVKVTFKVNTADCVGKDVPFVDLPAPAPPFSLAPRQSKMVFTRWTPTVEGKPCIKVEIGQVPGETDIYNNFALENISNFYSGSSRPWPEVIIPLNVAHPFSEAKRVDIEVANLPAGWRAKLEHRWVMLDPGEHKTVQAIITPPANASECTEATLNVYAQTRIDDYIQPFAGFTPVIHLADPIKFRNSVDRLPNPNRPEEVNYIFSGCTIPAQPNTEIAIQLERLAGKTSVVFVTTNAAGCFNKTITFPDAGDWNLRTYFAGSKCNAPTESEQTPVTVPEGPFARSLWFGFHLGHNFSIGSLRQTNNSGPSVTADLEYAFRNNLSLNYRLGYYYFNGKAPGARDLSYTNILLNTRSYFPATTWRGYVQAGFGVYIPNFGPTKGGLNVGTGLNFTIRPKLVLELETNFHFVDPGGMNRVFVEPKLGIKFRF